MIIVPLTLHEEETMSKSQDSKKSVKKKSTRTPAEKKALKLEKKNKKAH